MKPYEDFQCDAANLSGGLLRFLTAGSVDDGKSTLIGRLLFDSKAILADQVQALERAKHKRTAAGVLDLSLLTDGLEAEREQGITIDVAYRYFTNGVRKFIIADAPGHEQYTRNMVTAASNSDAMVLMIDPTRVPVDADGRAQLLPQTRRHAAIAALLGLPHVVAAVNKMDRVGFDETVFRRIETAVNELVASLGLPSTPCIPISALEGDNVVVPSLRMPWHHGPTLLAWLEQRPTVARSGVGEAARFVVQRVQRRYGDAAPSVDAGSLVDGWRALQGQLLGGRLAVGDAVAVLPSGLSATVDRIHTLQGNVVEVRAASPQALTISLRQNVDVSRGDVLTASPLSHTSEDASAGPASARTLVADLCWLDAAALNPAKKYWLQLGTARVQAKVTAVNDTLDLNTLTRLPADATALSLNQIGQVQLALASPVVTNTFANDAALGRFILVDPGSHQTAAAGLVREVLA